MTLRVRMIARVCTVHIALLVSLHTPAHRSLRQKPKQVTLPAIGSISKVEAIGPFRLLSKLRQQTQQHVRNKALALSRYSPNKKTERSLVIERETRTPRRMPLPDKVLGGARCTEGRAGASSLHDSLLGVTLKTRPGHLPVITKVRAR